MKVTLVGWTHFNGWAAYEETDWETDAVGAAALSEFAGRACYQSWSKPNPDTATNKGYLRHILEVGHDSVLRHGSATFYVTGVSRSFTHELIRHHVGTGFSQLSQRYVAADPDGYVVPPAMRGKKLLEDQLYRAWKSALRDYEIAVRDLEDAGKSRKEAREAARAFLPGCAETKIVVTGNHEAWRNIAEKRGSEHADAEIREFAVEILRVLKTVDPNIYQDLEVCEGGDGITTVCRRPL
jgi:thymidylate synthase (FAD)